MRIGTTDSERGKCPDLETLSAYYDREEIPDKSVLEHIETCEDCRSALRSFELIGEMIRKESSAGLDEGTLRSILLGAKRKIQVADPGFELVTPDSAVTSSHSQTISPAFFFAWAGRIAALFLISTFVFYLMYSNQMISIPFMKDGKSSPGSSGPLNPHLANTTSAAIPAELRAPEDSALAALAGENGRNPSIIPGKGEGGGGRDDLFGSIDLRNISAANISFGATPEKYAPGRMMVHPRSGRTAGASLFNTPAYISSHVEHVWIESGPGGKEDLRKRISAILKSIRVPESAVTFSTSENSLHMNIQMSSMQCALFVRVCADEGMKLLSPQQPQPEQNRFIGSGREPVLYSVDFVTAGKS